MTNKIVTFLKCIWWFDKCVHWEGASLVAQTVKNLPAMWEAWVWSLGQEDPLEKEMATHSSILAWRIPWTEEPGGLQFMGLKRVRHDWVTKHKRQIKGFPNCSVVKKICNAGDVSSILGLGRFPWGRAWQPIPVFLPEESPRTEEPGRLQSMGSQRVRYNWVTKHRPTLVHGVTKNWTWLSDSTTDLY